MKETHWQGRAGGLDRGHVNTSVDFVSLRDSIKIKKKKAQRGDLTPIEANKVLLITLCYTMYVFDMYLCF